MSATTSVGRFEGGSEPRGGRRKKRKELSDEQMQEISEAFALFDTDKDQALDYHELKVLSSSLYLYQCRTKTKSLYKKVAIRALGFDVKKTEVQKIMSDFDKDESGKISLTDFTEIS